MEIDNHSLTPEQKRIAEEFNALKECAELQTHAVKHDLTKEQLDELLGKREVLPKEIMIIPPEFEITEIKTSMGNFRMTCMYRDGERLISWDPTPEDASVVMPVSKFMQLAELIPTALNVLTGSFARAAIVKEDGEQE